MRPSSSPAPYRLFELAEVEGRRVGKLLLCQISCELRLTANLDLIHGHGNQLVAETKEAAHREDHCRYRRMVKINQHVFDLANGRVTLVDLAADQLGAKSPISCLCSSRLNR